MQTNKIKIEYESKKDEFSIIPIGDIHIGNVGCEVERFKELISWIEDKDNCYWIGMGDYCECINYSDKRFDNRCIDKRYSDLSNMVELQCEDFIELISPISHKCLGFHRGNHEESIRLRYHFDMMHEIYKAYRKPILDDTAITRLQFKKKNSSSNTFDIFSQHSCVGGRKGGNKVNWLEDLIGYVDADIYLIAHAHVKISEIKTQLYIDNNMNVKQKKKVLGVTGSFLKGYSQGYSSYVEKSMLPPTDLGVIKVKIKPYTGDIHVSI